MDDKEKKQLLEKFQTDHEEFLQKHAWIKVWKFKIVWTILRIGIIFFKIVVLIELYRYFTG